MTVVTYSDLRRNLAKYLDEAVDDREPIIVARSRGKGNVVLIAEDEYRAMTETDHLLANPANAERLLRSIAQADAGEVQERDLVDADAADAGKPHRT